MAKYFVHGSTISVEKDTAIEIHDQLPVGTYSIGVTTAGFHLEQIDGFTLPDKIYGNVDNNCRRILDTFKDRPRATGVHLDGVKGSGKTLLVKQLSLTGLEEGIPTIVINAPYSGEGFNDFIQSIQTPCIILFDEFEKVYCREKQEEILTLFDGVYPTKKLFVLTTNDSGRVSDFLKNRPGRMYYKFDYECLDPTMVKELLEDQLKNKEHMASVLRYTKIFSFINFDMLSAIIEEMNRYGESLKDVLEFLNIKGESYRYSKYDYSVVVGDLEIPFMMNSSYEVNRFSFEVSNVILLEKYYMAMGQEDVDFQDAPSKVNMGGVDVDMSEYLEVEFTSNNLTGFDEDADQFEYTSDLNGAPMKLCIKRRPPTPVMNPAAL